MANRTASRSMTSTRVRMSLIMKNVEPQAAVIASSAAKASSSVRVGRDESPQPRLRYTTYRVIVEPLGAWLRARGLL